MLDALANIGYEDIIVTLSAIAAALSFIFFAYPLLAQYEKKERYKEVIKDKRKALYEQTKEQINKKESQKEKEKQVSAAQSMAALYKLQTMAGEASINARNLMLQAGIRDPKAPLKYLLWRIILPVVLTIFTLMILSASDKEVSKQASVMIAFSAAITGFLLPRLLIKNMADKRKQEIGLFFPDALDMILICVQGGIGLEAAISRVGGAVAESSKILAEELGILSAELSLLNDRKAAYKGFAERSGSPAARSFVTSMIQAEQYGTSISKAIRVLADESRELRMSMAEQKAASLPPKLTVPMILFFLPPLFVIILGPAFMGMD